MWAVLRPAHLLPNQLGQKCGKLEHAQVQPMQNVDRVLPKLVGQKVGKP